MEEIRHLALRPSGPRILLSSSRAAWQVIHNEAKPRVSRLDQQLTGYVSNVLVRCTLILTHVDTIVVRAYEDRSDLLRSLIIGPANTPYEDAPFVIDWRLDSSFPNSPPIAHFLSWTNGNGRGMSCYPCHIRKPR